MYAAYSMLPRIPGTPFSVPYVPIRKSENGAIWRPIAINEDNAESKTKAKNNKWLKLTNSLCSVSCPKMTLAQFSGFRSRDFIRLFINYQNQKSNWIFFPEMTLSDVSEMSQIGVKRCRFLKASYRCGQWRGQSHKSQLYCVSRILNRYPRQGRVIPHDDIWALTNFTAILLLG